MTEMTDTRRRSVMKTLSWRIVATFITASVAWCVTHSFQFAAIIGGLDTLIKLFAYYFHERAWNQLPFGRPRQPDYQI